VELWELVARESIRDLVARYNANGDSGRFEQMLALFADDAVMELVSAEGEVQRFEGVEAIATIFTGTKAGWDDAAAGAKAPHHIRHFVATHQIDLVDATHATGRSYYAVIMAHGLDHWGRYLDDYVERNGRWRINRRRALSDG
jgi:3-phenylpropionate/cinnamic acid dioxygenase small subunit